MVWYRVASPKMTILYAIYLFQCIDFVPFSILQFAQELNVCEEVKQGKNVYQKEIRFKEFCPHVHNSIEEFLPMPLFSWVLLWSWEGPWNVLWN